MAKVRNVKKASVSSSSSNVGLFSKIKNYSFGESRSYLFEYGLLLLIVGALIVLLTTMIEAIILAIGKSTDTALLESGFGYMFSVGFLSTLIVLLPLAVLLFRRTRESEFSNPRLKNIGWRKAFLGIFLAFISIAAIIATVGLVYQLASLLAHLGLGGDNRFSWKSTLNAFFTVVALGSTAWLFGYDYRSAPSRYSDLQRVYRYALVLSSVLIGVLFIAIPVREQRDQYVDGRIASDLRNIRWQIDELQQGKGNKLPAKLNDLKLSEPQKSNAKAYKYEYNRSKNDKNKYSLCAVFRTDTRDHKQTGGIPPIVYPLLGEVVAPDYYSSFDPTDPSRHNDGRVCFDYQPNFYGPYPAEMPSEMPISSPPADMPTQTLLQY